MDWSDFWVICLQALIGVLVVCTGAVVVASAVQSIRKKK